MFPFNLNNSKMHQPHEEAGERMKSKKFGLSSILTSI
ncbi:unnamed protein product [Urochloa humidicola]